MDTVTAEAAFLSVAMTDGDVLDRDLPAAAFGDSKNRAVYLAMRRLRDQDMSIDPVTLPERLIADDRLEDAGGIDYLGKLGGVVSQRSHVEDYARIILEGYRRRGLDSVGRRLSQFARNGRPVSDTVDEALERLEALAQHASDGAVPLSTEEDLESIETASPLVGQILHRGTLAVLFGAPEAGKSFLLLDWAAHIARGRPWMGHSVDQGSVVYVYAEGRSGLRSRMQAWRDYHGSAPSPALRFVTQPVELMAPSETRRFVRSIRAFDSAPRLIILDTLARCMLGGDENSSTDMGLLVRGADVIREQTGATVLLAHHPNASGDRERGSTALRGAADTVLRLRAEGRVRTLSCIKQKDAEPFKPLDFQLESHAESAVVTPTGAIGVRGRYLAPTEARILRSLQQSSLEEGLSATAWMEVSEVSSSSFYNARKSLVDKGLVDRDRPGRGSLYRPSPLGCEVLEALTP